MLQCYKCYSFAADLDLARAHLYTTLCSGTFPSEVCVHIFMTLTVAVAGESRGEISDIT